MEMNNRKSAQQFNENRFTKIDMIKTEHSVAFMLNFLPNQEMKQHAHPDRELYLHVIQGTGDLFIDEEVIRVKEGDVIYCKSDEEIGFLNTSNNKVSIYATMTKINNH